MKLNLGCGPDLRPDYVNVDARPLSSDICVVDLSSLPWPWTNDSAEEILMLDFLEHFSYRKTESIVQECWRVLSPNGKLVIQVPDFEECAKAVLRVLPFDCNKCEMQIYQERYDLFGKSVCQHCGHPRAESDDAALNRLFGGQDYPGNWHHTAFTKDRLKRILSRIGFESFVDLEIEHQRRNWNFKIEATKGIPPWE